MSLTALRRVLVKEAVKEGIEVAYSPFPGHVQRYLIESRRLSPCDIYGTAIPNLADRGAASKRILDVTAAEIDRRRAQTREPSVDPQPESPIEAPKPKQKLIALKAVESVLKSQLLSLESTAPAEPMSPAVFEEESEEIDSTEPPKPSDRLKEFLLRKEERSSVGEKRPRMKRPRGFVTYFSLPRKPGHSSSVCHFLSPPRAAVPLVNVSCAKTHHNSSLSVSTEVSFPRIKFSANATHKPIPTSGHKRVLSLF